MEKQDIARLRTLPIETVAMRLGLTVTKHFCLCPFHADHHPSLNFRRSTNTFRCWSCGAHGSVIDLVMQKLNLNFMSACEWLASDSSIILSTPPKVEPKETRTYPPDVEYLSSLMAHPVLNEEARRFLFQERRLNPKVISWLGISSIDQPTPCWRFGKPFYDAPSLLIPYKDVHGNVQNVQSRYLGHESNKPRFRFPGASRPGLFGLPLLPYLRAGEPLYLSEGITDCLALLSAGHKALGIPSSTLFRPEDLKVVGDHPIHLFPDRDDAGDQLYQKVSLAAQELGITVVKHELPPNCKDYADYYKLKMEN